MNTTPIRRAVQSLDELYARGVEEGDCILWLRGCSKTGTPTVRVHGDTRMRSALRIAHLWAAGLQLDDMPGLMVWPKCENQACINHKHALAGTRPQFIAWRKARGLTKPTPSAIANMTRSARGRAGTLLSMDKARAIRAEAGTCKEVGERYGVSDVTVAEIRRGKTWREQLPAASIFSLARCA